MAKSEKKQNVYFSAIAGEIMHVFKDNCFLTDKLTKQMPNIAVQV